MSLDFDIKVYDNVLEIVPKEGIDNNCVYELDIEYIKASSENKVLENERIEFYTKMTPLYTTVTAVESLVGGFEMSESLILFYIRESSRMAEYISKQKFNEEDPPFEVSEFVKNRAAYNALLKTSIDMTAIDGRSGKIGEIQFEIRDGGRTLSDLLKQLKKDADDWEEEIQDAEFGIGAKPKATVRSSGSKYKTDLSRFSRETIR